jgi:hypothetical protein
MMPGQSGNRYPMAREDGQNTASHAVDSDVETIKRKTNPTDTLFDRDFPGRNSADQYLIFGRYNGLPNARFKP